MMFKVEDESKFTLMNSNCLNLANYTLECNIDTNIKFVSEKAIIERLDELTKEYSGYTNWVSLEITFIDIQGT
jgi:EAL domain-containing protein (putative c-di-GMP-specific phosphodiesterase class I)